MNPQPLSIDFGLEPADNDRLANLCGQFDEHLRQIEQRLGVEINNRGNQFRVIGDPQPAQAAAILKQLYATTAQERIRRETVHVSLQESGVTALLENQDKAQAPDDIVVTTKEGRVWGRGPNQRRVAGYAVAMRNSIMYT